MISYLEKFNNIPKELKNKISSPEVMKKIGDIEKKYGISLASVIMRLMVKEIKFADLADFFVEEDGLDKRLAEQVIAILKSDILKPVLEYLGVIDQQKGEMKNQVHLGDNHPVPLDEVPHYLKELKSSSNRDLKDKQELDKWMRDRKSDMSSRNSGFFFSPEDEEEVKMLAKKVAGFSGIKKTQINSEEVLEKILKAVGVHFSSEDMKSRFEQVMKTYIHGIRNRVDTKQTLIKSVEVGGLGIDNKQADKILQEASKFRREPEQPTLQKKGVKNNQTEENQDSNPDSDEGKQKVIVNTSGDVEYDFESLIKGKSKAVSKKEEEKLKEENINKKEETPAPLKRKKTTYVENKEEEEEDEKEEFIDLTKLENLKDDTAVDIGKRMRTETMSKRGQDGDINIIQARAVAAGDGRVKMEDVKHVPKLTGPIDELREMNVVNFRRLHSNPREAVKKIKKKISFLEEESYTKRFEGIKAWRQSPVNKLYLEIGQESIINKKPINVIINNRRQARKPFLSEIEFKAVMDLNKDLRF